MPEFTQEQLDQMINEAKAGLFTEEELTRRVTSEVDRRVESGIQKGLETQKQKWQRELEERAKLTAEELARKDFEEKMSTVSAKEQEIQRKANLLEAKDMLAEAKIPKAQYEKLIGMLVSDNEESTRANVASFIEMFNATKSEIEIKVKTELSNVPPPKRGTGDGVVTKEDFQKMGYVDKLKFKTTNPEQYKEFMSK